MSDGNTHPQANEGDSHEPIPVFQQTGGLRIRINKIQDGTCKTHWALIDAMMDQQARLRDLYSASTQDNAAIDKTYKAFGKLQQQMYDTSVDAQKRMEAVLTKEQQEKLHNYWRSGWVPDK
jgi:Spy/CpxP family protein refolding chaperone